MEIILVRHGKVNYPPMTMISALSFAQWVAEYDANELDKASSPDEKTKHIVSRANKVVCSTLPRSLESASVLGLRDIFVSDSVFNEAGLPIAKWTKLKMSVRLWAIFFRVIWFFGYSAKSESYKQCKDRASQAARKLIKLSEKHGSVILIGHRIFNHFMARELLRLGWLGPKKPTRKYWQFGIFECNQAGHSEESPGSK